MAAVEVPGMRYHHENRRRLLAGGLHGGDTITNDVYAHTTPTMPQTSTDLVEEMLTDSQDHLSTP